MIDLDILQTGSLGNTSCLTIPQVQQMIQGANVATIQGAGEAMMVFLIVGIIVGFAFAYVVIKAGVINV